MKTFLNNEKENKEIFQKQQKDIEGDESLFFFLYKKINIFYEFDEKKYATIFYNAVFNYDLLKKKYEEYKDSEDNVKLLKDIEKKNIKIIGVGGYGQVYQIDDSFCIKISLSNDHHYHEYYIAKELSKNKELKNSIINPFLLIKKNNFNGLINFFHINILFIYLAYCYIERKEIDEEEIKKKIKEYNIETEYKFLFKNENRKIINKASSFVNYMFIHFFNGDDFFILMLNKFLKILNYFKEYITTHKKKGYMMLMPLAEAISSNVFLNKNLNLDIKGVKAVYVYPCIYRMLFLQVSLFFLNVNKKYIYFHNDLKPDNILVTEETEPYSIYFKDLSFFFKEKFRFKIADFDFSKLLDKNKHYISENTINKKIENSKFDKESTWFFDIHFFIHKLVYYIGIEETELDKEFFLTLYELFIKPYCKISFNDLNSFIKVKIKKTNDVCYKGYFFSDKEPDISVLINFLKSDFFKQWVR